MARANAVCVCAVVIRGAISAGGGRLPASRTPRADDPRCGARSRWPLQASDVTTPSSTTASAQWSPKPDQPTITTLVHRRRQLQRHDHHHPIATVRQCHLQSAQPTADATTTTAAAAAAETATELPDYDDIHSAPPSSHCTLCTVGARRGLVALYGFAPRVTTSVGPGGLFCVILIRRPSPALGGYFIFVICA